MRPCIVEAPVESQSGVTELTTHGDTVKLALVVTDWHPEKALEFALRTQNVTHAAKKDSLEERVLCGWPGN
jgi:hypothetical protein